jgi:hypothetical protein
MLFEGELCSFKSKNVGTLGNGFAQYGLIVLIRVHVEYLKCTAFSASPKKKKNITATSVVFTGWKTVMRTNELRYCTIVDD